MSRKALWIPDFHNAIIARSGVPFYAIICPRELLQNPPVNPVDLPPRIIHFDADLLPGFPLDVPASDQAPLHRIAERADQLLDLGDCLNGLVELRGVGLAQVDQPGRTVSGWIRDGSLPRQAALRRSARRVGDRLQPPDLFGELIPFTTEVDAAVKLRLDFLFVPWSPRSLFASSQISLIAISNAL